MLLPYPPFEYFFVCGVYIPFLFFSITHHSTTSSPVLPPCHGAFFSIFPLTIFGWLVGWLVGCNLRASSIPVKNVSVYMSRGKLSLLIRLSFAPGYIHGFTLPETPRHKSQPRPSHTQTRRVVLLTDGSSLVKHTPPSSRWPQSAEIDGKT